MSTDLLFRRTPGGMAIEDQATRDAIQKLPPGQLFSATLHGPKKTRSGRHHRLFWALLTRIVDATGQWTNAEALLGVLKMSLGYYDLEKGLDGELKPIIKSIAFDKMDGESFRKFFDDSIKLLSAEVLPDIMEMEEYREINIMLDGYDAAGQS